MASARKKVTVRQNGFFTKKTLIIAAVVVVVAALVYAFVAWRQQVALTEPTPPAEPIDASSRPIQKETQSSRSSGFGSEQ